MCLSAHFRINLTANPSSVDLTVSSQPYATHQTQTRTKRERYQNQHHGDPTKVKNCNEFLPHFCLPDKFCAPTSWKTVITKGRHKKKQNKQNMKWRAWLGDMQKKRLKKSSRDGNMSACPSGWMDSIWKDMCRMITKSLPLARNLIVWSLTPDFQPFAVKLRVPSRLPQTHVATISRLLLHFSANLQSHGR